jgi:hypothetical protein
MRGHVACMGKSRYAQRGLVGRTVEKKPFERLGIDGRKLMDLQETEWKGHGLD